MTLNMFKNKHSDHLVDFKGCNIANSSVTRCMQTSGTENLLPSLTPQRPIFSQWKSMVIYGIAAKTNWRLIGTKLNLHCLLLEVVQHPRL